MSTMFGVDLDRRRDERTYRALVASDDDFHDAELSDRWWETETCWFSWNVRERSLGGWAYCQARPNANICNGGAWVWDDAPPIRGSWPTGPSTRDCSFHPGGADMRDFEWPNGVHVRMLEPLTTYAVRYSDPGALEVDLVFEAIMAPNPHPNGVVPFVKGVHFNQAGHVTGTMACTAWLFPSTATRCAIARGDRGRSDGQNPDSPAPGRKRRRLPRGWGRSVASAIRSVLPDQVRRG